MTPEGIESLKQIQLDRYKWAVQVARGSKDYMDLERIRIARDRLIRCDGLLYNLTTEEKKLLNNEN
jgi:hypothetical protein